MRLDTNATPPRATTPPSAADLRAAAQAYAEKHGTNALLEVFRRLGERRFGDIKPKDYPALAAALRDEPEGRGADDEADASSVAPGGYARTLDKWGLHVHPLKPNTKAPIGEEWPQRSRGDSRRLFEAHPKAGLGFIPGRTIDPRTGETVTLVHVDVDGEDAWRWFQQKVPAVLRNSTVAWRTARGGYGFLYRARPGLPVTKASVKVWKQDHSDSPDRKEEAVELRIQGNGVLPPTRVTIGGTSRPYRWLPGAKRFEDFGGPREIPLLPDALATESVREQVGEPKDHKLEATPAPEAISDQYFRAVCTVAECIEVIPAEAVTEYDDAVQIGMMIHSALPDDTGFRLWDLLCRKAETLYAENPAWTREKWNTFHQAGNATGQLTLGSLVVEARKWHPAFEARGGEEGEIGRLVAGTNLLDLASASWDRVPGILSGVRLATGTLSPVQQQVVRVLAVKQLQPRLGSWQAAQEFVRTFLPLTHGAGDPFEYRDGVPRLRALDLGSIKLEQPYVVAPWIPAGAVIAIIADYSLGKTWLIIDLGLSKAFGVPWFGHPTEPARPVVFAIAEGNHGFPRRVMGWLVERGLLPPRATLAQLDAVLKGKVIISEFPLRFDHPDVAAGLIRTVEETGAALLVVDTLGKSLGPEQSENDNDVANAVTGMLSRVASRTGCAALVTHHTGHSHKGRGRGASAWTQGLDTTYVILGAAEDLQSGRAVELVPKKMREEQWPPALRFRLKRLENLALAAPDGAAVQFSSAVVEPATEADLPAVSGIDLNRYTTSIEAGDNTRALHLALAVLLSAEETNRSISGRPPSRKDFNQEYNSYLRERAEKAATKAPTLSSTYAKDLLGQLGDHTPPLVRMEKHGRTPCYVVTAHGPAGRRTNAGRV